MPVAVVAAAAAVAVVGWALVLLDLLPAQRGLLGDGLQIAASALAAVALRRSADGPRPALGTGTRVLARSAATWCATDVAWAVASRTVASSPDWLNLGYVAATLGYALGAARAAELDHRVEGWRSTLRVAVDALLLTVGLGVGWWVEVWEPLAGQARTGLGIALSGADAIFLAAALLAWFRSPVERRRAAGLLAMAAVVLLVTDIGYLRDLFFAGYAQGGILDLGWSSVSVALVALATIPAARPGPALRSPWATWAQAAIPPLVVLVVLGDLATSNAAAAHAGGVTISVWAVIALLGLRQVLLLVEHLDLTRRLKESVSALAHRADHDDLTGLLDRRAFTERAEVALAARQRDGRSLALLWVDLDSFKRTNDVLGHAAGDAVLQVVAARLQAATDDGDVAARLGGDEFVILRPLVTGRLEGWAESVRRSLSDSISVAGSPLRITCSIGLLEADGSYRDLHRLMADADLAMYRAKQGGRNRVEGFHLALRGEALDRNEITGLVRRAVADGSVLVHYQPVVDLASGAMVGAEALVRIDHPTRGLVGPADFLAAAEAMDLMADLAFVVLGQACALAATDASLGWISVNLGSAELEDPRLIDRIQAILDATGLDPQRLVIEVNERVVPEPHILRVAGHLAHLGVRLALDDFGTGWSSLAQLRDLPLHLVKLDRSVVAGAGRGAADTQAALLRAMIELARSLGVIVLAEGVETDSEAHLVHEAGATLAQGYRWSPAVPAPALAAFARSAATEPRPAR